MQLTNSVDVIPINNLVMKFIKKWNWSPLIILLISSSCTQTTTFPIEDMVIRMAELEIDPRHLDEYLVILKEEAEASVRLEPGVITIYPMYEKDRPTAIRILEIYASQEAYESHLQTPHFLHYKTATSDMVKSLRLVDMAAIDGESMKAIFRKLGKY
jgi:quinol monooxygenase YgiN